MQWNLNFYQYSSIPKAAIENLNQFKKNLNIAGGGNIFEVGRGTGLKRNIHRPFYLLTPTRAFLTNHGSRRKTGLRGRCWDPTGLHASNSPRSMQG